MKLLQPWPPVRGFFCHDGAVAKQKTCANYIFAQRSTPLRIQWNASPVRTSFNLRRRENKRIMYQLKVDVDKLNVVKVVVN